MKKTIDDVLQFWFANPAANEADRQRWFNGGGALDEEIRQRFLRVHEQLRNGLPAEWPANSEGLLAAIIVIDQFSRNLFRGTAQAFAWDSLAIGWATTGWDRGWFAALPEAQQCFSLLPFVHSEQLALHDIALEQLTRLSNDSQDPILTGFLSSAIEHRAIIADFGRYPHRNDALQRNSSPAEVQYLASGPQRFGQ